MNHKKIVEYLDHKGFENLMPDSYEEDYYEFDLSRIKFIKPHGAVALLLLLKHLHSLKKSTAIFAPLDEYVSIYFAKIGFWIEAQKTTVFFNLSKDYYDGIHQPSSTMYALTKIIEKTDIRPAIDKFSSYMETLVSNYKLNKFS